MGNVYDAGKIVFHPEKLASLAKGEVSAPVYVRVKPTNKCNHRCFYCSYDPAFDYVLSETLDRRDWIPRSKMMEILDDFRYIGVKAVTYSGGGEPLLHPNITEIFDRTMNNGIDLSIITNGQLLDGDRAAALRNSEWVRVSADSPDVETFARTRRVSKDLYFGLVDNLKNFARDKNPKCELGINFVIQGGNSDKVYEGARFFKLLGANHIKFSPLYTPRGFEEYHAQFKKSVIEQIARAKEDLDGDGFSVYSTYENDFDLSGKSERTYEKCFIMETVPVIGADSTVYFCHDKAYSSSGKLGSIKERSFRDLWFSDDVKKVFSTFNARKGCAHHCANDCRNLAIAEVISHIDKIDQYKPASDRHKNFV